ncbi:MAG: SurA N-terminal domain-containing protein [Alphaproteobacteria bacterium]|nr:SurA N-terminal domain-containing protein [Alphaproteobacteria bacterium]
MLNHFRSFSGSIVTKILMLLLIASFGMWGIGDMLGSSASNATLAKIGSQSISVDSFQRELAVENDRVRRQLGANYSEELIKRLNVPQFVIRRMVQEALLRQEAERMGFIPDDTTVAFEIRKTPAFLNGSGVFDRARFETALRNQSVSEKTYVERTRMQLATDKLLDALLVDMPIDDKLLATLQAAYDQGRTIALFKLSADSLNAGSPPTDDDLKNFQKLHAEAFTIPEYRTVSFVRFSADDAKATKKAFTEEALNEYYHAHEDQFHTPEKREVEQLLYSNEEKAKEAYEQVKTGKPFADIAQAIEPLNRNALSLGFIDRKGMLDSAADTVFRLKAGGFTEPVKSPFGWHIFRVATIQPEGVEPLEKVRAQVEAGLRLAMEETVLTDKINQIEDALAGGSTLKEAAAAVGLPVEQAGSFDKEGKTPQGAMNTAIPKLDKFIDVAFKTEEKTESSVTSSRGGIYYVLRVDALAPEKLRPFAEAKADIIKAYKRYQGDKAVADAAGKIEAELGKHKKAADIIAEHKLHGIASGSISRGSKTLGETHLPPSFIAKIFSADIGELTPPMRDRDGNFLLAHITGTAPRTGGESDVKLSKNEMVQQMQEEMMMQYLQHLETLYPVDIHQETLDQLTQEPGNAPR